MFDLAWQKLSDIKLILCKEYKELYNNNYIFLILKAMTCLYFVPTYLYLVQHDHQHSVKIYTVSPSTSTNKLSAPMLQPENYVTQQ